MEPPRMEVALPCADSRYSDASTTVVFGWYGFCFSFTCRVLLQISEAVWSVPDSWPWLCMTWGFTGLVVVFAWVWHRGWTRRHERGLYVATEQGVQAGLQVGILKMKDRLINLV